MVAGTGIKPAHDPKRGGSINYLKTAMASLPRQLRYRKRTQPTIEPFEEFLLLQWQIRIFRPRQSKESRVRDLRWFESRICSPQITELLISNPAPARSNIDKATCAMIRRERARCDSGPTAPRLPSCRDSFTFGRDTCRAGKPRRARYWQQRRPRRRR